MKINILAIIFLFTINVPLASQKTVKIWDESVATKKMKQAEMITFIAENNPGGLSVIICPEEVIVIWE